MGCTLGTSKIPRSGSIQSSTTPTPVGHKDPPGVNNSGNANQTDGKDIRNDKQVNSDKQNSDKPKDSIDKHNRDISTSGNKDTAKQNGNISTKKGEMFDLQFYEDIKLC